MKSHDASHARQKAAAEEYVLAAAGLREAAGTATLDKALRIEDATAAPSVKAATKRYNRAFATLSRYTKVHRIPDVEAEVKRLTGRPLDARDLRRDAPTSHDSDTERKPPRPPKKEPGKKPQDPGSPVPPKLHRRFVVTLNSTDVSGSRVRRHQDNGYVRIPAEAQARNPSFWGGWRRPSTGMHSHKVSAIDGGRPGHGCRFEVTAEGEFRLYTRLHAQRYQAGSLLEVVRGPAKGIAFEFRVHQPGSPAFASLIGKATRRTVRSGGVTSRHSPP